MLCKCGSKKEYSECCGRFIESGLVPQTPEELMRSRYSAYALADIGYIVKTMQGRALVDFDAAEARAWAQSVKWLKLEVVQAYQKSTEHGFVEFKAYYRCNNKKHCLLELSEFQRENGHWYYIGVAEAEDFM